MKTWLAMVALAAAASACGDNGHLMAPSPLIVPDVAAIGVGASQTFTVEGAAVERFDVRVDGGSWAQCLAVDAPAGGNRIQVVALRACTGLAYVTASLGRGRSPLVAVLAVE